jgi:tetratricopeptide (TPR) repeat protein
MYDLFISHNKAEKAWARELVAALKKHGITYFFDEESIGLGENIVAALNKGLESSRHVALILSPDSVRSRWVELEWACAVYEDADASCRRVIPILKSDCEIPLVLRRIKCLDARALDPTSVAETLSSTIRGIDGQKQRIDVGLSQQKREIQQEAERRALGSGQRVVGERPARVVEYFKDREEHRREIGRMLADSETRLVSIVGRGGLGKTALASRVLADMESNVWPHTEERIPVAGIVYASTRTAGITLERIFSDCARLLGGDREAVLLRIWTNSSLSVGEKIHNLLNQLSPGIYVVLLDNLEELLDENGQITNAEVSAFVDVALTHVGNVRLLVTTRVPLRLRQQLMRFNQVVQLELGLPVSDGIRLMRELDPNNEYLLRDATEDDLSDAVKRVHGVPRAIELLVGLLADDPFLKLKDLLLYRVDDMLRTLVETAYHGLDESLQHVVQALSVYGRPMPGVAIDFLLAPFHPGLDVPGALRQLQRIHMVSVDRATSRAYLHPLDRELAYGALPDHGDYSRASLERQAAAYYRKLRLPPERWRVLDDLDPHLSEFEHLLRAGDDEPAAEVLTEIDVVYLAWYGHAERVLAMWQRLENSARTPRLEMHRLYAIGHANIVLGPLAQAVDYLQRARQMARCIGEEEIARDAGGAIGDALRRIGQYEESTPYLAEIVADYRKLGESSREALWLFNLSVLHTALGDMGNAVEEGQRALTLAMAGNDSTLQGRSHNALSLAYLRQRDSRKALSHAHQALALYQKGNVVIDGIGYIHSMIGVAHLQMGHFEDASVCFAQASHWSHDAGQPRSEAIGLLNSAFLFNRQGRSKEALDAASRASVLTAHLGTVEHYAANTMVQLVEAREPALRDKVLSEYLQAARRAPDLYSEEELADHRT